MIIIKVCLLLTLLILLLRLKLHFTIAILFMALVVGISFGLGWKDMGDSSLYALINADTLNLMGIVGLILGFSELLNRSGQMTQMSEDVANTFGLKRITLTAFPMLIGLLPMPGGALFSAPLVDKNSENIIVSPVKKTIINYWFRHIWEYGWYLYLGLILLGKLSGLNLYSFSIALMPLIFIAFLIGVFIIFPGIKITPKKPTNSVTKAKSFGRLFVNIFPFILIIVLFSAIHLYIIYCLLAGLAVVIVNALIQKQLDVKKIIRSVFLRKETYIMMSVVAGVMIFVAVLKASTLTGELTAFFQEGMNYKITMFYSILATMSIPFIMGLLTGLSIAFVGTAYPIIAATFIPPEMNGYLLPHAFLFYTSGLAGVMLSPVHLCLILTNQYFGSSLKEVYKYLIIIVGLTWLFAFGLFWLYLP
ncbi:MAG: DUF401 family protein [Planctomycetes bacterium]|nr:DUF401 family protein [Planctomycetota bacterium]